jgi:hypothetical protein
MKEYAQSTVYEWVGISQRNPFAQLIYVNKNDA